jgi:SAM-dependent methyltransferase
MVEVAMGVHHVAASGFGAGADDYERGRPSYPPDVVTWLVDRLGIGAGSKVVDLAAGTGKFTRLLSRTDAEVVAVEPVEAMRAKLAETTPGVVAVDGTAEAMPFPDRSIDAVTVAQAFHWFDAPVALGEIARVLRPGGGLLALWNEAYQRDPLTKQLFDAVRAVGSRIETIEVDWRIVFDDTGLFEPARRARWRWEDRVSHADLLASIESRSYVSVLDPVPRAEFLSTIAELLAGYPEPFPLPYVTEVYWCRKSGRPPS